MKKIIITLILCVITGYQAFGQIKSTLYNHNGVISGKATTTTDSYGESTTRYYNQYGASSGKSTTSTDSMDKNDITQTGGLGYRQLQDLNNFQEEQNSAEALLNDLESNHAEPWAEEDAVKYNSELLRQIRSGEFQNPSNEKSVDYNKIAHETGYGKSVYDKENPFLLAGAKYGQDVESITEAINKNRTQQQSGLLQLLLKLINY